MKEAPGRDLETLLVSRLEQNEPVVHLLPEVGLFYVWKVCVLMYLAVHRHLLFFSLQWASPI